MFLSIVIPTCNRNDLLGICLEQLLHGSQTIDNKYCEVIVTDDSLNYNAREFMEEHYPEFICLRGPRKGPAANRNNGAHAAKGKWLVFLDDDCIPARDLLEQYTASIENNPGINVFEGKIISAGVKTSPLEHAPLNEEGGHLWSCNFAIRRDVFFSIGGFDEMFKFPHMEDIDLRKRLMSEGESILFSQKSYVAHPWRETRNGKKLGQYQEMFIYFQSKHGMSISLRGLLKEVIFTHLNMARNFFFTKHIFLAFKVMFEHVFVIVMNYHKWKKKYVG